MKNAAFNLRRKLLVPISICIFLLTVTPAPAKSPEALAREGVREYYRGNYDAALEKFEQAREAEEPLEALDYNIGTTMARQGNYDEAARVLQRSLDQGDAPVRSHAFFNRGLSEVSKALETEDEAMPAQRRIELLEGAAEAFRQAIIADADDAEAKHNFELTRRLIKRLEQQQQQNDRQQQQQQQQQNGDQKGQNEGEQNQRQENRQQQQEQEQEQRGQNENQERSDREQGGEGQEQSDDESNEEKNKDSQEQNDQRQQRGLEGTPTPQPTPGPRQTPSDGGGDGSSSGGEQPREYTPEQLNALSLLNALEETKPEQFKRLFKFRGTGRENEKDW